EAFDGRGIARYMLAESLSNKGKSTIEHFQKAMDDCDAALEKDPLMISPLITRGNARSSIAGERRQRGEDARADYRAAIADYTEVLKRKPDHAWAYNNRSQGWRDLSQGLRGKDALEACRQAVDDAEEAVRRNPANISFILGRGQAFNMLGYEAASLGTEDPRPWFEKALADLEKVLAKDRTCMALNSYGLILQNMAGLEAMEGRDCLETLGRAISIFTETLRKNPAEFLAYLNRAHTSALRGQVLKSRGENPLPAFQQTVSDCTDCLHLIPHFKDAMKVRAEARWEIGKILAASGRDPKAVLFQAVKDASAVIGPGAAGVQGRVIRGKIYKFLADFMSEHGGDPLAIYLKAAGDFELAIRSYPQDPSLRNHRGMILMCIGWQEEKRGRDAEDWFEKAVADYETASKLNPSMWQAHANRGRVLEDLFRFEDAVEAYEKALRTGGGEYPPLKPWLARARAMTSAPQWVRKTGKADYFLDNGYYAAAFPHYKEGLALAGKAQAYDEPKFRSILAGAHYNVACCLSRLYEGKVSREAEPKPVPPEKAAELRTSALASIHKAFELGFTDLDKIRKDPDLVPIRDLPEFKALLAERQKRLEESKGR
ncbi:MAG: tetratricopeptide repeat protein, partial [Planctomycetota bacterium]